MKIHHVIAVVGSSSCDNPVQGIARELGYLIGAAGCHLICGGRGGVMEAACQGHHLGRGQANVVTLGLLPGTDRRDANPFIDVVLTTGIGFARNAILVRSAEAVVAVAGGAGTLSEISLAWQFGLPIATITGSGGWSEMLGGQNLDSKRSAPIFPAPTPSAALNHLLEEIIKRA